MSLWIKICANTSLEDALFATEAGANAVGFVFARSPRQITVEQVAALIPGLPESVEKIGVFVDASVEEISAAVRTCGLTGVQLHSEVGPDLPQQLRQELGPDLRILRVVHYGPEAAAQAASFAADPNVDAVLIDSRTATVVGGTGISFNWDEAGKTLFGGTETRLIAAGGLHPDNVPEAIAKLRPWGVDVASGVEASPGRKDPEKVRAFIRAAQKAATSLELPTDIPTE